MDDEKLRNPPAPWTFHVNDDIGAFYYYNTETGVSQWEYPGGDGGVAGGGVSYLGMSSFPVSHFFDSFIVYNSTLN